MPAMLRSVSLVAFAAFLVGCIWLARTQNGGPLHADLVLAGDIPATVYLPVEGGARGARKYLLTPPPPEERPPAVVVMHGFAEDRASMSGLARRIADSGYAVLSFDAMGHGANRNPLRQSLAVADGFAGHFEAAVDFLRTWPFVDGERIAVLGHSMGAQAALDYASRDSGVDAAVLVSGGGAFEGPYPPPNTLFLWASRDPERLTRRVEALAARLAGVAAVEPGTDYGRHDRRNAVRVAVVSGADHASILWMEKTVAETVAWLDACFGRVRQPSGTPGDPRAKIVGLLGLAFVALLPGLGRLTARLVPHRAGRPSDGRGSGLLLLAGALALTVPLLAPGTPAPIVSAELLDTLVPLYALAGLALLVLLWLWRPDLLHGLFERAGASVPGALIALLALYALLAPFGPVLHRIALTPERTLVFGMAFAGFFPLQLAFNVLLRRGGVVSATGFALAGRLVVLLVLVGSVHAGVFDTVLLVMLPMLALAWVLFEVFAAALYAGSCNLLAVALVDAGWLALVGAAVVPVRL